MIILYFHVLPQFKYELFHILHIVTSLVDSAIQHFNSWGLLFEASKFV